MRIGDLRNDDDIWYDINRATKEEKLIREMVANVREYILPHFGRALSKDMVVDLLDQETSEIFPFEKLIAFMVLGEKERAKKEYKRLIGSISRDPSLLERIKNFGKKHGLV